MLEIRFHGRGGTGTVTASRALAKAVFYEGKHAVTFPSFGAERRGAPVLAFARIDENKIRKRTQIYEPDVVVVLDDSLVELGDVVKGLKKGGLCIVNTTHKPEEIQLSKPTRVATVNATKIAKEEIGLAITNSAILGALVRATDVVSLENLKKGIMSVFGEKLGETAALKNAKAAERAYNETVFGESKGGKSYESHEAWLPTVDELPKGTIIPKMKVKSGQLIGPGSAISRVTGTWTHEKAVIDQEKCIKCLQCVFHCPEGTIHKKNDKIVVDWTYCKACGVCITQCPVGAISYVTIDNISEILDHQSGK